MSPLVDSDVLIDCLRGRPAALRWLEENSAQSFLVPGAVAMELIAGCRDKAELLKCRRFLGSFDLAWPDASESARAFELFAEYRLATGIGIPDAMIAAAALVRQSPLFTFNSRHFAAIPGIDVREPYAR